MIDERAVFGSHNDRSWRIRFADVNQPRPGLPAPWLSALRLVTADLLSMPPMFRSGEHASVVYDCDTQWHFAIGDGGFVGLGLYSEAGYGFEVGRGYRHDCEPAAAAAWAAEVVQDQLAGYEFCLWPVVDDEVLSPGVEGDCAVWIGRRVPIVSRRVGQL